MSKGNPLTGLFPEPVLGLPRADIPIKGCTAFLSQGEDHQIIFMTFAEDVDLPPHSHKGQWGIVLEGKIELEINGVLRAYHRGDRYYIPEGTMHSGKIYAGYTDMTFFHQKDRYRPKDTP